MFSLDVLSLICKIQEHQENIQIMIQIKENFSQISSQAEDSEKWNSFTRTKRYVIF